MKKIAFLLTLLTLILTPCCNRMSQYERILADIDSLIGTDADSARNMLLRMDGDMKDANEDTRAYYNLLLVKADEWAKKEHASDSLINTVVEHFEKHDPNGIFLKLTIMLDVSTLSYKTERKRCFTTKNP